MSPFNRKANLWVAGRKSLLKNIEIALKNNNAPIGWFHCASLGEFEQARPLIEKFKIEFPRYKIFLTFFSPSGYEIRKNYAGADFVFYLPPDTKSNAEKLIAILRPTIVFFTKYEFWYHYLTTLKSRSIPVISFSSIFRKEQIFFKPYGRFYLTILKCFDRLFVQDQHSVELLKTFNIVNVESSGDTRFDRVCEQASLKKEIPLIEIFKSKNRLLIIGSSWPADIEVIQSGLLEYENLKIIIAPHEIKQEEIASLEKKFSGKTMRFSKASNTDLSQFQVLIIDNIGMLSSLYQYADLAYIGGGFGSGIHNVLEAVAFGVPVIIGPNYTRFKEARDLVKMDCAFSVKDSNEFTNKVRKLLSDDLLRKSISQKTRQYVLSNAGATNKILQYCHTILNP